MRLSTALKISIPFTLLLASATHALAQEGFKPHDGARAGVKADVQSGAAVEAQLKLQARELAASTADEALKWDDKQAAVRVLSQAADLLWGDYPERAREWLTRAWEMTRSVTKEDADNSIRRFRSNSPQAQARATVLAVAHKHDGLLARRLLEQLTNEKEQSQYDTRHGVFDDRTARSEQLLNAALMITESDPAAAAELAEQSLADGVSFQLQRVLLALRGINKLAADRLFDRALNRLANGFLHPSEGQILASYLFTPGRIVGSGADRTTALAVGAQSPTLNNTPAEDDPARTRRFLCVMQRALLSMPVPSTTADPAQSAQEFMALAGSLANGFKVYAPELWLPVEQRTTQIIPDLAPARVDNRLPLSVREELKLSDTGAGERDLNSLYVEGLEKAAEKESNPAARKLILAQAALATLPEELERGRRIAARIDEVDLREQIISLLVYRTALLELERGQLDKAVKLVAEAKPLQRALVLITAARRMTAEGSSSAGVPAFNRRWRALELLTEAGKLLELDQFPGAALRVRLSLVAALAPLDQARALEAFGNVVKAINDDASFDASETNAPRITNLVGFSYTPLPRLRNGFGLKDAVTPLARADFEGCVMLAAKLSAPAVRGTCMLQIAQSILSS